MGFHIPDLPFTDPLLIFAVAMAIFLLVPLLFERFRVPGLIGLIVAGAVIGPSGLGLIERDATIILLGTVGLIYLMFLVGLELDLHEFQRHRKHSITFGFLSFLLPQGIGTGLSLMLGYGVASSVLLGAMFASHTLLAYPIASRLGIVKTGAVTTVLGATLLTDMLALFVLAIVSGAWEGGVGPVFWLRLFGSLAVYITLVLWGVPRIARWYFRRSKAEGPGEYTFTLLLLFGFAYLAHFMGIEPIIGALLTGFALNRLIPEHSTLMNRTKFVADTIFVPFFLLSVGMLVDVRAFADQEAWMVISVLVAAILFSKALAAKVTARWFGYSSAEGWLMFGLSVSHAAATMAIVLVGYELGIFDETIVNAVVVIILVTCLVGPWAVGKYGREVALQEEQKPYAPGEAPQRILIPVSNPATEEALLDLAFLVHGPETDEPIHPLMVVRATGEASEAQVAEAEKLLGHAVIYAAGADVPVIPLTRVDRNVARGIARGVAETRSSTIIIGWDGAHSRTGAIFGSVLDQLLERTQQLVLVTKLGHPLNTTRRIVLVIPRGADRNAGFFDAARILKLVAGQLGAELLVYVVGGDVARFERHFGEIKPALPATYSRVDGWASLIPALREELTADDLVVVMSARKGTVSWHADLERLPRILARLVPESFVMVYPATSEAVVGEATPAGQLPEVLVPEQVVFDLPPVPFEEALMRLLEVALPQDPDRWQPIAETLVELEQELSTEVRPGVVIPHARVPDIEEPVVILGVSPEGIDFPAAKEPAKLIFLFLSPAARPDAHLRSLAAIVRLVRREENVRKLIESRTVEDLENAFGAGVAEGDGVE